MGMRTSSEGKQASLEDEQHVQDENVAEANMMKRLMLNPRNPIIIGLPTVVNEVRKIYEIQSFFLLKFVRYLWFPPYKCTASIQSMQLNRVSSSVVRYVKDSEGHLS